MSDEKITVIAEYTSEKELESIREFAEIKYYIPCINSCAFVIDKDKVGALGKFKGIRSVHENAHITAQMNSARQVTNADNLDYTGEGITIAVLDTGIAPMRDFIYPQNRIIAFKDMINGRREPYDDNGHGTHVSGIACGNGVLSDGIYKGIAPRAKIVSVKILKSDGSGNLADVLAGIQWIIDNRERYGIKIANLSIGTESITPANEDPLVKAVNYAWDLGIAFIIAAGNNGPLPCSVTSPGVSRKAVTVGAVNDDKEINTLFGERIVNYSGRGPTRECIVKPDTVAPSDIVSCFPPNISVTSAERTGRYYARLSGTSMSTPVVSGAVALLLQKYPFLSPNDIKLRIKKSCRSVNMQRNRQGWGLIDINELLNGGNPNE